jgi:pimeloyl-ACP methyl ester carboxylesterase
MTTLKEETVQVGGTSTRLLRGGPKSAPAALFLHGGTPGFTPFCAGAHLWGAALERFSGERQVIAPDLPGSGGTAAPAGGTLTFDSLAAHVSGLMDALELRDVHIVAHDLAGLIALFLAMEKPERFTSVSVVASALSAPQGDSLDDLVFADPPTPLWGWISQKWALERLCHSHYAVDDALVDACVAAGEGAAHKGAVALLGGDTYERKFAPTAMRAKMRLWELLRTTGLKVPVQLVWGSHDPTTTRERGATLYGALAERQTATHFHVVNRAGNLVFRDQPEAFHHVVAAFQDGVLAHRSAAA